MKLAFSIAFTLICSLSLAQKEATWWYFYNEAGMQFENGSPQADTNANDTLSFYFNNTTATNIRSGHATSISDKDDGSLLFYASSIGVFNRDHQIMPNGLLMPDKWTDVEEGGAIIPRPNRENEFYYLYIRSALSPSYGDGVIGGIFYNLVDMTLDNGLGDVVDTVKNVLLTDSADEKIDIAPHANGIDYWIMIRKNLTNKYHCYLVTEAGISTVPVVTALGLIGTGYGDCEGNLRFNHAANMMVHNRGDSLEVYDFNNASGILSNWRILSCSVCALGLEFSPDDSKLYVGGWPTQYDVTNPSQSAMQASETSLYIPNNAGMGGMQLGPDGKIYGNAMTGATLTDSMSVIHNPNEAGTGCQFEPSFLYLEGKQGQVSVPKFISSFFQTNFYADTICVGEAVHFFINFTFIDSVFWNFGDPASGGQNTSTAVAPSHVYSDTGHYTVTLIAQNGIKTDTVVKTIYVKGVPTIDLGPDHEFCILDQDSLTLGNNGEKGVYLWSDGSTDSTLLVVATEITDAETYWLEFTDECGTDRDTIDIVVSKPLSVSLLADTVICLDTFILNPTVINENIKTRFKWNTEELARNILAIADGPHQHSNTFSLLATNACGSDSEMVKITFVADPDGYLPSDSLYCSDIPFYVLNPQSEGISYEWNDGTTGPQYRIDSSATVSLLSYSQCDTLLDEFTVEFIPIPQPNLGSDTAICVEDHLELKPVSNNASSLNFAWSTLENDSIIMISDTGLYSVTVTLKSCARTDSLRVYQRGDCYDRCKPNLSNIITPNADGINDRFGSFMECNPTDYRLQIFNRWGQVIFESADQTFTWDGYINGAPASDGTYFYVLSYMPDLSTTNVEYRGSLSLIR